MVVVLLVAAGLYWFQPWRLWTNTVVAEQLPVLAAVESRASVSPPAVVSRPTAGSSVTSLSTVAPTKAAVSPSLPSASRLTAARPAAAVLLAGGQLISHEHETSGVVQLVRLPDGHRVVVLKDLRTSDGPALHVWLSDAPVRAGSGGWRVFDDGRFLDLGALKGNIGDQVYPVPDDVDVSGYSSVSIWCERFSVSFGAAELKAA